MRGAVTLAAALAIPLQTDSGAPFPHRDLIIFLAFSVILVTLLLQGLTLPGLIKMLALEDDGKAEREETKARLRAAEAAIARIDELQTEEWVREDTADRLRTLYQYRLRRFTSRFKDPDGDGAAIQERSEAYQRLLRAVLDAQRDRLLELRAEGVIDDAVLRSIERDLDLEDARLEI
jgi:CPA1 family monovalent cation:H+ antiporter